MNVYIMVQTSNIAFDGVILMNAGLPQNHQAAHGFGNNKEAPGQQLLLVRERVYPGLQHNVHKLLCLQQAWRGCGSNGANSRETVFNKSNNLIFM